jgi:muramoyltetrapeptide carboxypeptidase
MSYAHIPSKIKAGSNIRVIAAARSLQLISKEITRSAIEKLELMGVTITFGKNAEEIDIFSSSSVASRIQDINDAFLDNSVDAILTVVGGYNSIQLLRYLDYDLIKQHPKILCGFSDITTLSNAIFKKTSVVGYSGPHFSTFGMKLGIEYTIEYFHKCLFSPEPYRLMPSPTWSDDIWFLDQHNREFLDNDGYWIINNIPGTFEGTTIGGHLRCFNALQGSEFIPELKHSILFIEEDDEITPPLFDRQLQSVILQPDFSDVCAVIIGRFQKKTQMTRKILTEIVQSKRELRNIPVVGNIDFGHTTPIITYPIGGKCLLSLSEKECELTFLSH